MAEVRPSLNVLREASREMRDSQRFRQILQAVLVVGNALNHSTFRGAARGFELDSLLKVGYHDRVLDLLLTTSTCS